MPDPFLTQVGLVTTVEVDTMVECRRDKPVELKSWETSLTLRYPSTTL